MGLVNTHCNVIRAECRQRGIAVLCFHADTDTGTCRLDKTKNCKGELYSDVPECPYWKCENEYFCSKAFRAGVHYTLKKEIENMAGRMLKECE